VRVRSRASLGEVPGGSERVHGPVLDVVGFVLLAALAGWILLAASFSGGGGASAVGLVLAAGAAYMLGRLLGWQERTLGPVLLLAVALGMVVISPREVLSAAPLSGPFGYLNAKAAFFAQASIAGLLLSFGSSSSAARAAGVLSAMGFAIVVLATTSLAALGLLVGLPLVALTLTAWNGPRAAVATCGVLFGIALLGTTFLGARYEPDSFLAGPQRLLTERRLTLWSEALEITADRPLFGVGPGRFQEVSPTALADQDARWAHNEFLQLGAETGVAGLLFLVAVFAWGFARLFVGPGDSVTALGAAALAALGIHACLDYVLHFAPVALAGALLVGGATSGPRRVE
jgi:O-antigen ligase